MSSPQVIDREQVATSRRRGPAFGEAGPPPEVEAKADVADPLDGQTEAMLGFAIVTPVLAAYAAIGYGVYTLVSGSF